MKQITLLILLAGLPAALSQAGDWHTWRGPDGSAISKETAWSPASASRPENVVWRTNVGKGHSTVAVRGNRLYTMGQIERSGRLEEVVYCIDTVSGKEIWRYAYPINGREFPGSGSTPVVNGNQVFVTSREGEVYCLNAQSGSVMWKRDLVAEGLAEKPQWGFCASAAIEGNLVILNAGKAGIALNSTNGQVVWASAPEVGWLATPVLFDHNGRRVAAISSSQRLHLVEAKTGAVIWSHRWLSSADPIVVGEHMYLKGGLQAHGSQLITIAGDQPEIVWDSKVLASSFQGSIVVDGHAYGFGRIRGKQPLACVEVETGKVKWKENLGDWGSLIAAGDKLIIVDGGGTLIVAQASPEAYQELARARIFNMKDWKSYPRESPNTCWTAPVLANSHIYARNTYGDLVCVKVGA